MPQIPFLFSFECEWPNDLCVAELPFGCSEMFIPYLLKIAKWQFGRTFQNKNYYNFECEWANGNLDDFCMAKLPFSHSHSNANANAN